MITHQKPSRQPTRQRLLEEGVRLFAKNGFTETTVGEIEAAAGLEPRRGALYRHFPSKEALLEAALEAHLDGLVGAGDDLSTGFSGDVREAALALGHWLLAELDREELIVRILEQDGDKLSRLRDRFREALVDSGYQMTSEITAKWIGAEGNDNGVDPVAAVLLGGLINYRRSTWTFGQPPAGLSQDRYLSAWADLCATHAHAQGHRNSRSPRSRHRT